MPLSVRRLGGCPRYDDHVAHVGGAEVRTQALIQVLLGQRHGTQRRQLTAQARPAVQREDRHRGDQYQQQRGPQPAQRLHAAQ